MVTILAKDVFNTEYLCAHHAPYIRKKCEELNNEVLDVAGMKIVKDAMDSLCDSVHQLGCKVIDTKDKTRNDMLKQVLNRRGLYDMKTAVSLPELQTAGDLITYLKALEIGVRYTLPYGSAIDGYYAPLVTLIQLHRPNIEIEVSMQYNTIASYISYYLNRRGAEELLKQDSRFVLVNQKQSFELDITTKDPKEKFKVPGIGSVNFEDLMEKFYVIPKCYGEEKVLKDDKKHNFWKIIREAVLRDLDSYFDKRKATLKDFLGM